MLNQLENISLVLDFIPMSEAKRLIDAVNHRLTDMFNAYIVDVMVKKDAEYGTLLVPFSWVEGSARGAPSPHFISDNVGSNDKSGLWSYVYRTGKPVWLEYTKGMDTSKAAKNLATGADIEPKYLNIFPQTESFMAVPLIFRGTFRGLYSIETTVPGRLSRDTLEQLQRLSVPVARILWKADAQAENLDHTTTAINTFTATIMRPTFEEALNPQRVGFFARSFRGQEFSLVQNCINHVLHGKEVDAPHFIPRPGRQAPTVHDIMRQIASAHFGIVDITGCLPNVMLELGMMMILRKKLFLLRSKADQTPLPFDVSSFLFYEYELVDASNGGPAVRLWSPAESEFKPIGPALESFVEELMLDREFSEAKPWCPPSDETQPRFEANGS